MIGLPGTMTQPRKADAEEREMADAPTSKKGERRRTFYNRARALGVVGGLVGIAVAAWTAIDEGGGPVGSIGSL